MLIIEELEELHRQTQRLANDALERMLRRYKLVVVATSNDASRLVLSFCHRFRHYVFSGGTCFAEASQERLAGIWEQEAGDRDMPPGWQQWGWDGGTYSLRRALEMMEDHLVLHEARTVA